MDLGEDALLKAVHEGSKERVCSLVKKRESNVNKRYKENKTALIHAAERGHSKIVDVLLSNEAECNAQDEQGWTPLMFAASMGRMNITKHLIKEKPMLPKRIKMEKQPCT